MVPPNGRTGGGVAGPAFNFSIGVSVSERRSQEIAHKMTDFLILNPKYFILFAFN